MNKGDKVVCKYNSGHYSLTEGKEYTVLGTSEGIFKSRPFIIVLDDSETKVVCHARRFRSIDNEQTNSRK